MYSIPIQELLKSRGGGECFLKLQVMFLSFQKNFQTFSVNLWLVSGFWKDLALLVMVPVFGDI